MAQLARAIRLIAATLHTDQATYGLGGRIIFRLDDHWSLALSADDAGRFRLEACLGGMTRATMWCLAGDEYRLAELVADAEVEVAALVA